MIPKILHYCWFGNGEMPKTERKCMKSWRKHLPDYEIRKWSESNFDVLINKYVEEAYRERKYMFVSDYARLYALYNEGGVYLDTDCMVMQSFTPLLNQLAFTSFGGDNKEIAAHAIASEKGNPLIKECLDSYKGQSLYNADGSIDSTTINIRFTEILKKHGFKDDGTEQIIEGLHVYPMTYFCPVSFLPDSVPDCFTENTYCNHIWSDPRLKLERSIIFKTYRKIRKLFKD